LKFSERNKHKPVREIIQIESIDVPLRNGIWNLLQLDCWVKVKGRDYGGPYLYENKNHQRLCVELWVNYFKEPLDSMDRKWRAVKRHLRDYFFTCEWYEVYDFIEFVANNYPEFGFKTAFIDDCNELLEREVSAYRFVDGLITQITEEHEIAEIEGAMVVASSPVTAHLRRSLELLSDKEGADYRNSIKESISAVESFVKKQTDSEKGTLGQLLKELEEQISLHPALQKAFNNLLRLSRDPLILYF